MTQQAWVPLAPTAPTLPLRRSSRRERRAERHRLDRHAVLAARLAELARMQVLLADAGATVGDGWVQHAWFRYRDEAGRTHVATAHDLDRMAGRPVVGACLVGGVVHAGGGPAAATSQLVRRTLELTWHTLHGSAAREVAWTPSPPVHAAHVRDLTRWNDATVRTGAQVGALLAATASATLVQAGRVRQEQLAL